MQQGGVFIADRRTEVQSGQVRDVGKLLGHFH